MSIERSKAFAEAAKVLWFVESRTTANLRAARRRLRHFTTTLMPAVGRGCTITGHNVRASKVPRGPTGLRLCGQKRS